jgi:signal transduction histidine kinase
MLSDSFSQAASRLWDVQGEQAAMELIYSARGSDSGTSVRWVSLDSVRDPIVPDSVRASLSRGQVVDILDKEANLIRHFVPVYYASRPAAGLELRHSLGVYQQSASEISAELVWASVLSMFVYAGVALLVSHELVGRPLRKLTELARTVARGDLTHRVKLRQNDEISRLGDEMNRMCDELEAARARVMKESDARLRAVEQLRHADRLNTVGKLAAGVAHELGTPLNVISGRASMIVTGEATGPEVGEYAEIIVAQADRMTRIIRQLLAFARQRSTERARVDLVQVVREAAELLSPIAKSQRVTIEVVADQERVEAVVDAARMQQVVTNLVMNGIQAMAGGGQLLVHVGRGDAAVPEQTVSGAMKCNYIRVQDQGVGITPEILPHIFEPFFTTKDIGEGSGLGLSVSYGIVREHGGWIDVSSRPGSGAALTVFLPQGDPSPCKDEC